MKRSSQAKVFWHRVMTFRCLRRPRFRPEVHRRHPNSPGTRQSPVSPQSHPNSMRISRQIRYLHIQNLWAKNRESALLRQCILYTAYCKLYFHTVYELSKPCADWAYIVWSSNSPESVNSSDRRRHQTSCIKIIWPDLWVAPTGSRRIARAPKNENKRCLLFLLWTFEQFSTNTPEPRVQAYKQGTSLTQFYNCRTVTKRFDALCNTNRERVILECNPGSVFVASSMFRS